MPSAAIQQDFANCKAWKLYIRKTDFPILGTEQDLLLDAAEDIGALSSGHPKG